MNFTESQTLTGHSSYVLSVARVDENTIVSGSSDDSLKIWDVHSGKEIETLTGHDGIVESVAVINPNTIVSGSLDRSLRIRYLNRSLMEDEYPRLVYKSSLLGFHTHISKSIAVIDENTIVSVSITDGSGDSIKIWDVDSHKEIKTLTCPMSHKVICVAVINPNTIVTGGGDGTVKIWDVNSDRVERLDEIGERYPACEEITSLTGHTDEVTCVIVINPTTIVSGSRDHSLKVWDLIRRKEIMTLTGHSDDVHCVAQVDENTIVSGSLDKLLKIWDVNSGEVIQTLTGHSERVWCVAVIDPNTIVSGSEDKSIKIWRTPPTLVKGVDQNASTGGGGGGGSLFATK